MLRDLQIYQAILYLVLLVVAAGLWLFKLRRPAAYLLILLGVVFCLALWLTPLYDYHSGYDASIFSFRFNKETAAFYIIFSGLQLGAICLALRSLKNSLPRRKYEFWIALALQAFFAVLVAATSD